MKNDLIKRMLNLTESRSFLVRKKQNDLFKILIIGSWPVISILAITLVLIITNHS